MKFESLYGIFKAEAVREAGKYPYLKDFFSEAPLYPAEVWNIVHDLDRIEDPKQKATLEAIFTPPDPKMGVAMSGKVLKTTGLEDVEVEAALSGLVKNRGILKLLPYLWDEAFKNDKEHDAIDEQMRFALGMLTSQLRENDIPAKLRKRMKGAKRARLTLRSCKNSRAPLCPDGELSLDKLVQRHNVVMVDEAILNQKAGYDHNAYSGLCLYPLVSPNGILIPGMWYSTSDKEIKEEIEKDGVKSVESRGEIWTLMRPVVERYATFPVKSRESDADFLDKMRAEANASQKDQAPSKDVFYVNLLTD